MTAQDTGDGTSGWAGAVTWLERGVSPNDRIRPPGISAGRFPSLMLTYKNQTVMRETSCGQYHPDRGRSTRTVRKRDCAGNIRRSIDAGNRSAVPQILTGTGEKVMPLLQAIGHEGEDRVCAGPARGMRNVPPPLRMRSVAQDSTAIQQDPVEGYDDDR